MIRPIDRLLPRLGGVKQIGPGKWITRCPAHDDGRPSLSVREAGDGKVLLHCFAGCGAADVVSSVGLDWPDLFADRLPSSYPRSRSAPGRPKAPSLTARDALNVLDLEALTLEVVAHKLRQGTPVEELVETLERAAERVSLVRRRFVEMPR